MEKSEALKKVRRIAKQHPDCISFSNHAEESMRDRKVSAVDVLNVLSSDSARIAMQPELEKGSWRYRVETKNITVVVSFTPTGLEIVIVTVFRRSN